jgi:hypothetical protein
MEEWLRELAAVLKRSWFLPLRPRLLHYTCAKDYIGLGLRPYDMYMESVERLGGLEQDHKLAVAQVLRAVPAELHPLVWCHLGPTYADGGQWYKSDAQPKKPELASVSGPDGESDRTCKLCQTTFPDVWSYWGHTHGCDRRYFRKMNGGESPLPVKERKQAIAAYLYEPTHSAKTGTRVRLPRFPDVSKVPEVGRKIMAIEATVVRPPPYPLPTAKDDLVIAVERYPPDGRKGAYCGVVHAPAYAPVSWLACAIARKWLIDSRREYAGGQRPTVECTLTMLTVPYAWDGREWQWATAEMRQLIVHQYRHVVEEHFAADVQAEWDRFSVASRGGREHPPTVEECETRAGCAWVHEIWRSPPTAMLAMQVLEYIVCNDLEPYGGSMSSSALPHEAFGSDALEIAPGPVQCQRKPERPPPQVVLGGPNQLWEDVVSKNPRHRDSYVIDINGFGTTRDAAVGDVLHDLESTHQPSATSMKSRLHGAASKRGDDYFMRPTRLRHSNELAFCNREGPQVTFYLTLVARKKPLLDPRFYASAKAVVDAAQMPLSNALPLY